MSVLSASGDRPAQPKRTRSEDLRLHLADEIVRGVLEPGTQLDEIGLAARFGVSRTPVREALRQLSASGLVEIRPHRGAIVTRLPPERLFQMFQAMAELEAICAGLAAEAMTIAERRELEWQHKALAELVSAGDPTRYAEANEIFHNTIYAGSHNAYLAELTVMTRTRLAPFRRAQFRRLGRLAQSYREHEQIVRSIMAGDRARAIAAMRAHIGTVREAFDEYIETL